MKEACVFAGFSADTLQSMGIKRSAHAKQEMRINRQPAHQVAEMASALPMQAINSDSFALLEGGPKGRRQFMDWGVFHVKHEFLELWRRAQKAVKQRNSLLRRDKISVKDLEGWDRELCTCAEKIHILRRAYMERLTPFFDSLLSRLLRLDAALTISYEKGWPSDQSLAEALRLGFGKDCARGHSLLGPHRANIGFVYCGRPAAEVLSRGQQKLVVCALKLAQGFCYYEDSGKKPIFLVDDLAAELDAEHRSALCCLLHELGGQVFISCVDVDSLTQHWPKEVALKEFHVKHGELVSHN